MDLFKLEQNIGSEKNRRQNLYSIQIISCSSFNDCTQEQDIFKRSKLVEIKLSSQLIKLYNSAGDYLPTIQQTMEKTFSSLPGSRTVGNYIISKNLGEGTFGKVKLGIHTLTQEKVAIKILEKSKITDVADVERVTRQINILKQVRHPNIIQLYQIIETPKQLFLVMEYVSEGELFEFIVKKKRLKETEACEFFQQILAGVEYLHQLGIVHRDLKPQNLLIDFNKRLKLVDFGLSNTYKVNTSQKQLLKTACGSPCYAAPEMIAGKKYEGLNADLWSCGIILFAMVCGYLPFEDPNTSALYKKIISGQFLIPKYVSASCKDLLRGILTTDPNRRYSLQKIKNHQWFKQLLSSGNRNEFYNPEQPPIGIAASKFLIPVDEFIVDEVRQFEDIDEEQIKKYIANNRHNHTVTAYYLLLKKNLRLGIHSPADICGNMFNQSILIVKDATEGGEDKKQAKTDRLISTTMQPNGRKTKKNPSSIIKEDTTTNRTLDSVQLDNSAQMANRISNIMTPIDASRAPSRAVNRINLRDYSQARKINGTAANKKRDQSIDFKYELDSLPIMEATVGGNGNGRITAQDQRRRKGKSFREDIGKKEQSQMGNTLVNFYDVEENFRTTHFQFKNSAANTARTRYNNSMLVPKQPITKAPMSFRSSLDRYQQRTTQQRNRYISLDIGQANSVSLSQNHKMNEQAFSVPKSQMNKTFMGRISRNNDIPKWSDESQRIRSILNKTITGHGSRKKRPEMKY